MSEYLLSSDKAVAITPSDTTNLQLNDRPPRAVYVGGAGNVNVQFGNLGTSVLFSGVPAGTVLPIGPTRVMSTSTTATAMVALY
ncbi:MAG: hypothetical protein O2782_09470 [bacterium]|nr:hypothetical protein [bacterium]